jgi:hypothetical protein
MGASTYGSAWLLQSKLQAPVAKGKWAAFIAVIPHERA